VTADYELEWAANDEVEDLLEHYADARLVPPPRVLARIRRDVMAHALVALAAEPVAAARPQRRRLLALVSWPRIPVPAPVFALGFSILLAAATGTAVVAAPPGSAFYNTRLVLETAFMPPVTDSDARLAAYEEQFASRIAEAQAAAARGDQAALNAALAAYQNEITNAVAELGSGADLDRLSRLEAVLGKHIANLQQLATKLPTQVARDNAVTHAVAASERAVEKIQATRAHLNEGNGAGGAGGERPTVPPGQESSPPNRP
jgi:uncharacterized protein DUF5667